MKTIEKLNELLANYQLHYQNLRGLHWNIKGPQFFELHAKFEELYTQSAQDIDELAERILALDGHPLHTYSDYIDHSSIVAAKGVSDASNSVKVVIDDLEKLLKVEGEVLDAATAEEDEGTADLVTGMIKEHEKSAWMFKAYLK
jgi:starvation-inducible DNA-binding protein